MNVGCLKVEMLTKKNTHAMKKGVSLNVLSRHEYKILFFTSCKIERED